MATRRYSIGRHAQEGSGKGSENGVRPEGNYQQRKVRRAGIQPLLERRVRQDMALVHKFLTEKSGTDIFRQIAANYGAT